jgi:hypothetical protein
MKAKIGWLSEKRKREVKKEEEKLVQEAYELVKLFVLGPKMADHLTSVQLPRTCLDMEAPILYYRY